MNTKEILQQFEAVAAQYLQELEQMDMEKLTCKPDENEWSLGQMYLHLSSAALHMQLRNIEMCREKLQASTAGEGKTEGGQSVFAQGSFPPIRIQVPASKEYTPQQPESKEQIAEGMKLVIRRMRELEPSLADISLTNTAPHPRFGSLNAIEWYKLVEMHYRHHLHQLERLKQFLLN